MGTTPHPSLTEAPKGFQCIFSVSTSHLLTWSPLLHLCFAPMVVSLTQTPFSVYWATVLSYRRKVDCYIFAFVLVAYEKPLLHPRCRSSPKIGSLVTNVTSLCYLFETLSFAAWCSSTCNPQFLFSFQFAFVTFFHFLSCRKGLPLWQLFYDSPFRLHITLSHVDQTTPNGAAVVAACTDQHPLTMEGTTMPAE